MEESIVKELKNYFYQFIFQSIHTNYIFCAYQIIKMIFSNHYFLTIMITVLAIWITPTAVAQLKANNTKPEKFFSNFSSYYNEFLSTLYLLTY